MSFKENDCNGAENRIDQSIPATSRMAHDSVSEDRRVSRFAALIENLSEVLFCGAILFLAIAASLCIFSLRYGDAGGGVNENVVLTLALSGIAMAGLSMTLGWSGTKFRSMVYQVKTPLSATANNYSRGRPMPSSISSL